MGQSGQDVTKNRKMVSDQLGLRYCGETLCWGGSHEGLTWNCIWDPKSLLLKIENGKRIYARIQIRETVEGGDFIPKNEILLNIKLRR